MDSSVGKETPSREKRRDEATSRGSNSSDVETDSPNNREARPPMDREKETGREGARERARRGDGSDRKGGIARKGAGEPTSTSASSHHVDDRDRAPR